MHVTDLHKTSAWNYLDSQSSTECSKERGHPSRIWIKFRLPHSGVGGRGSDTRKARVLIQMHRFNHLHGKRIAAQNLHLGLKGGVGIVVVGSVIAAIFRF